MNLKKNGIVINKNMLDIFKKNEKFLMLALDHRGSFKKYVSKKDQDNVTDGQIIDVKKMIIDSVRDDMSGVLIDPNWGIKAYTNPDKPFLLCLERTGYSEKEGERITELEYTAEELKKFGASGAKILLYFNPEAKTCQSQLNTARIAIDQCREAKLPLFLEIVTYGNEDVGKPRSEWVLRSVGVFIEAGIRPDVFKLEYPGDEKSCQKITQMLGATPWILLTRGEPYEVFAEQLKIAIKNGAVGFLAGRAIWQEIANCTDDEGRKEFLHNIAKKRFQEICRIAGA